MTASVRRAESTTDDDCTVDKGVETLGVITEVSRADADDNDIIAPPIDGVIILSSNADEIDVATIVSESAPVIVAVSTDDAILVEGCATPIDEVTVAPSIELAASSDVPAMTPVVESDAIIVAFSVALDVSAPMTVWAAVDESNDESCAAASSSLCTVDESAELSTELSTVCVLSADESGVAMLEVRTGASTELDSSADVIGGASA